MARPKKESALVAVPLRIPTQIFDRLKEEAVDDDNGKTARRLLWRSVQSDEVPPAWVARRGDGAGACATLWLPPELIAALDVRAQRMGVARNRAVYSSLAMALGVERAAE